MVRTTKPKPQETTKTTTVTMKTDTDAASSIPEPICEFTNPCTTSNTVASINNTGQEESQTASKNLRKVISHIFGRNKTATKLFPPQVWVHYCRKHYQRARYRSKEWPFTQCDLLLDSLDRMEDWQGVRCFEVILRRREVERHVEPEPEPNAVDKDKDRGAALPSPINSDRDDVDYECRSRSRPASLSQSQLQSQSQSQQKRQPQSKRRKPTIEPAPVPAWLRHEVGPQKSFEEVRGMVQRLRDYLTRLQDEGRVDEIRFPDIEILPSFEKWVLDNAAAARGNSGMQG